MRGAGSPRPRTDQVKNHMESKANEMKGTWKILLPLLLIVLLVGCGKEDDSDTLAIEGHDWTSTQAIDSTGNPIDLPTLTCTAQDGSLSAMDADGNAQQSGTYSLVQRDTNSVLYDLSLDGESGTAVVSITKYADESDGQESEYTLILSLPDQTVYFRANLDD